VDDVFSWLKSERRAEVECPFDIRGFYDTHPRHLGKGVNRLIAAIAAFGGRRLRAFSDAATGHSRIMRVDDDDDDEAKADGSSKEQQARWAARLFEGTPEAILRLVDAYCERFSVPNLSTAVRFLRHRGGPLLRDDPRLGRLAACCARRTGDLDHRDVLSLACAWDFMRARHRELFGAIAAAARDSSFASTFYPSLAKAFAAAGVAAPRLFRAIADRRITRSRLLSKPQLAKLAAAFACVEWKDQGTFLDLGSAVVAARVSSSQRNLMPQLRADLSLAALYVRLEFRGGLAFPSAERPGDDDGRSFASTKSPLRRGVSAMLVDLGWNHVVGHPVDGLFLDLADPASKCAVEVFTHQDYYRDLATGDWVLDGFRRCKSRLLTRAGWRIAHLSFLDWESADHRLGLLRDVLHQIGASFAPPPPLEPRLQALHDLL